MVVKVVRKSLSVQLYPVTRVVNMFPAKNTDVCLFGFWARAFFIFFEMFSLHEFLNSVTHTQTCIGLEKACLYAKCVKRSAAKLLLAAVLTSFVILGSGYFSNYNLLIKLFKICD